ncbi:MAG: nitrogen fixation protein NifH, partial [Oscillospiraceae bacterium]|nr:nitrogen fixation protein NifH [Oscillospiraceae bacterium]
VNYEIISGLLARMGIEVNCRFLGGAQVSQVRRLKAAPLNLLASDGEDNIRLRGYLEKRFGCRFFEGCLPVGFRATARFLEQIGEFFGCREAAAPIIEKEKALYKAEAARLAPRLRGKRILMTTINANLDWLIDAARAVGMEFVWIGVLNYLHRELSVTAFPERGALIEEIADWPAVTAKIKELKPDIVLSNYTSAVPEGDYIMDNMPMGQLLGFRSGLELMDRWARLGENRREGDWTRDRELFEKYYS